MSDEDRVSDELAALVSKADLNQKTAHRFGHLEALVSADWYFATRSEDEIAALRSEFQSLSEEDQHTVISNATTKTTPGYFHLSPEEVDKVIDGRKNLPSHERANLSKVLHVWAGFAWLDLGEVLGDRIELVDSASADSEPRPLARVIASDRASNVEIIDIVESVRQNAACIGHPAIMFAIYHWQRVIQAQKVFERGQDYFGIQDVQNAERNLEAVTRALLKGPTKTAFSLPIAVSLIAQKLNLDNSLLNVAWERLHAKYLQKVDSPLEVVEGSLRECKRDEWTTSGPQIDFSAVSIEKVMDFLKTDGSRFVGDDANGESRRPSWAHFKHAFIGWSVDPKISAATVQQHLEDARKMSVNPQEMHEPSFASPQSDVISLIRYVLTTPLARVPNPEEVETSTKSRHAEAAS